VAPLPTFHDETGTVRFWVDTADGSVVGATISKETLHYRFQARLNGTDAVETYATHRAEIDAVVQRRIATGSIEPVMLREADFAALRRA